MKEFDRAGRCCAFLILAAALTVLGCKSNQSDQNAQNNPSSQPATDQTQAADDPANANVVPISNTTSGTTASSGESDQYNPDEYNQDNGYGEEPETYAQQAPPELPQYEQPPCPEEGDIWTPGYWSWAPSGYYWVPGAWVSAPYQGALWTPPYWGWRNGRYAFYRGYWGRHIGFYGGINYGFGYVGTGYQGGYWRGNQFEYNTAVNHVNTTQIHNVYNYRITNVTVTRVSYNGPGGVQYRPRPAEVMAIREEHTPPMTAQVQLRQHAQTNRAMFYNTNHGRPATVVVAKPLPANRNVRPPAPVNYAQGERPPVPPAIQKQQRAASTARPEAHPAPERQENRPAEHPQATQPQRRVAPRSQPQRQPGVQHAAPQRPAPQKEQSHTEPERKAAPEHAAPKTQTHTTEARKPEPEKKKPEDRKPE